jgi:hypothetical protein
MPVNDFPYSLLKPPEIATVAKAIAAVVAAAPEASENVRTFSTEIAKTIRNLEARSGQKVQVLLSQPVAEADVERDDFHKKILLYVQGAQHHPDDQTIADAGKTVYALLELHNTGLARESYAVESHLLNALLLDFELPQYVAAIATLGISRSVANLRASQSKFESLQLAKNKNKTELTIEEINAYVTPIRDILLELLSSLRTELRRNPELYTPIVNQVNGLIDETISKARARVTRKKNEAENAKAQETAA